MPLIFKEEPKEVTDIVKRHLDRMTSKMAFSTPKLAQLLTEKPIEPFPTQPLPVYNMGLEDLAVKPDSKLAVHTGWRFLLKQENEVIASAETVFDSDQNPKFAQINEGPLVAGTVKALKNAKDLEEIEEGEYEVRFLLIPALYVAVLWLVDKKKNVDLAIPVAPTISPLEPNKVISMKELMDTLQKTAKALLDSQPPDAPELN